MNKFEIGDVVEALTPDAKRYIDEYGDVIVSISTNECYLRFKGSPRFGYTARAFQKKFISLENI